MSPICLTDGGVFARLNFCHTVDNKTLYLPYLLHFMTQVLQFCTL